MATAAATAMAFAWTRWFRCESSFDLSLVPKVPGLFAVGRRDESGQQLRVLKVEAADDLFHTLNQLFSTGCPLRQQLEQGQCLLRYASIPDAARRNASLAALQDWLADPGKNQSRVVEEFLRVRGDYQFGELSD